MNYSRCHQPASFIQALQRELFPLLATTEQTQWRPKVDIKEEQDKFIVIADVPGVDPQQIDIAMDGNILTVKGERLIAQVSEEENYYRSERVKGKFSRQFTLPEGINADKIKAKANHGVLVIELPKVSTPHGQRKIVITEEVN